MFLQYVILQRRIVLSIVSGFISSIQDNVLIKRPRLLTIVALVSISLMTIYFVN